MIRFGAVRNENIEGIVCKNRVPRCLQSEAGQAENPNPQQLLEAHPLLSFNHPILYLQCCLGGLSLSNAMLFIYYFLFPHINTPEYFKIYCMITVEPAMTGRPLCTTKMAFYLKSNIAGKNDIVIRVA